MDEVNRLTDEEWLSEVDPYRLVEHLQHLQIFKTSHGKRKLRLLCVACCRAEWHLFTKNDHRNAIEVIERSADGNASRQEVREAIAMGAKLGARCE